MTDVLNLRLENCYGIRKLQAELEFKHKGYAIYAPNGVMKTSFAKTMLDISKETEPRDLAFPDRNTICEVNLNNDPIKPDEVFVVKSYDESYDSKNQVSTLLANEDLKKQYEEVHKEIETNKKVLDKKLRSAAGYGDRSRQNIDAIVQDIFKNDYYEALNGLKDEVDALVIESYNEADYTILFNQKVLQLLAKNEIGEVVEEYAKKYDELTKSSPILRENFKYHNVNQIHYQLKENNFFAAGHSINLSDEGGDQKEEFETSESLLEKIESEKKKIISDEELLTKFNDFNSKLKNKDLETFRDYITQNQHLLPELTDMEAFKRKLWLQYLLKEKETYLVVPEEFIRH